MIKVMIIEDDPMVMEINYRFLNKIEGFKVCKKASNLKEAYDYILKHKLDLILLDIYLPRENGLEFLKKLRKDEIGLDAIIITADRSKDSLKEALMYGAVDYIIKPFTFNRFEETFENYRGKYIKLENLDQLEQNTVDKLISNTRCGDCNKKNTLEPREYTHLIKGLNKFTYEKIWEHIHKRQNYFTAEEIAKEIGMARITIRKYLEYMCIENKLGFKLEYGKVGRPRHEYKVK
ncbi:response regulator [Clostridium tetani]|uniref:response regulator n=1 Tax=Clostridium tetani TaxID=1513 RepID=UPI0029559C22|nr:response regulator [Clostridium tetani]BDR64546.1 transcriptional regulatory protein [Clostridium tetani]